VLLVNRHGLGVYTHDQRQVALRCDYGQQTLTLRGGAQINAAALNEKPLAARLDVQDGATLIVFDPPVTLKPGDALLGRL
jgi:hypothetical protein